MPWRWLFLIFPLLGCGPSHPPELGVWRGELVPCPDTPNCVSSQSTDRRHAIDPIVYTGSPTVAAERLLQTLNALAGARVVSNDFPYIRASFTTRLCRFVDDVEFYIDDVADVIHVRSASRVGYSDLGTNRRRMERIRREFTARAAGRAD